MRDGTIDAHYDVVVVGGGSAGCVLAARLSEDPHRRVLLLEAGPDPQPLPEIVADAAQQARLLLESPYVQMYPTQRAIDGSTFYSLAGRIMGGGSSVNFMAAPRPTKYDLDTWAALGNPAWSYEKLLPVMKRIEWDRDFPDSPIHGASGPLHIERPPEFDTSRATRAFVDRATSLGLPLCPDVNGPDPRGVCLFASNVKEGRRQSTAVAYLDRARGRPNLTVVAEALVESLQVSGRRVDAVRFQKDGRAQTVTGARVVLSAGVFHTPQVLMLSGIGPARELERLGIPVVHRLDGVGRNYQDHAVVIMTFEGAAGFKEESLVARFKLSIKSAPDRPCDDIQILPRAPVEVPGISRLLPIAVYLVEQRNRGRVSLANTDPHELPLVEACLLEHPDDVQSMIAAMRWVCQFMDHDSMREFYGPLVQPGPSQDWATYARSTHDSYHHGAGTCMMGPSDNEMAVVDQTLRVHGMDNLWIADASIMPTVPHANTNLTAIMIGEVASDFIKAAGGS